MLDAIGLFDEDLGAYCEDVDLAFRAQLAGYRCVFVPEARVYHRLSASGGGSFASYYCGRNFISVAVKNMPPALLRKHWRRILAAQARIAWESLLHLGESAARARLRGQWDGVLGLPAAWAKRRDVLALQRVSDSYIESVLTP
jgi:GT2 family glycosyltransferase